MENTSGVQLEEVRNVSKREAVEKQKQRMFKEIFG